MNSTKHRKDKRSKKERKLSKLIKNKSDSEDEGSEHELSFYIKDRVRLMKEILKIIKPKKLKTMAPDCMKKMDMEEVNSLLLEELLGISSKRLKYIFEGKTLEEDSSSSDEDVKPEIDVISLDDISEDDFIIDLDSDKESSSRKHHKRSSSSRTKHESRKKLKKEKLDKEKSKEQKDKDKEKTGEENLMTVLELLELQARARAIRSQLALESSKKAQEQAEKEKQALQLSATKEDDEEDAVIAVETSENVEIVITSESEEEGEILGHVTQKNKTSTKPDSNTSKDNSVNTSEDTTVDKNNSEVSSAKSSNAPIEGHFPRYSKTTINPGINENSIDSETNNSSTENNASTVSNCKNGTSVPLRNVTDIPLPVKNTGEKGETMVVDSADGTPINSEQTDTGTNKSNESDSDNENLNVIRLRLIEVQKETKEQVVPVKPVPDQSEEILEKDNEAKEIETKLEKTPDKVKEASVPKEIITNLTESSESEKPCNTTEPQYISQISTVLDEQPSSMQYDEETTNKLDICVQNVLEELKSTEPEKSPTPKKTDDGKQKSKERRILNLKNRLKSYKNEVDAEPKIRIIENVVVKAKSKLIEEERSSVEESEGIIINVDQDEFDCIICD